MPKPSSPLQYLRLEHNGKLRKMVQHAFTVRIQKGFHADSTDHP